MGDEPSPTHFDSRSSPYPIMNVLIWNCKGAMKPKFKTTFMELVSWHHPVIFVVTETHISGSKDDTIIRSLPFDGAYSTETLGFAGGIWFLWRSDLVDVEVISATEQEVHALVRVSPSTSHWLLSAIYASPRFVDRIILWNNLKLVADSHNLPWAVIEDFNDMVFQDKKFGGNPICCTRVRAYMDCMDYCHLLNLSFSGPKFTWTNM